MKNLLDKKNVIGYSEEDNLVVFVSKKVPLSELSSKDVVPSKVKGKSTSVVELGEIKPLVDRGTYRPLIGGCEIGVKGSGSVGTAGIVVKFYEFNGLYLLGKWKSFLRLFARFGLIATEKLGLLTNAHVTQKNILFPREMVIVQRGFNGGVIGKTVYNTRFKKDKSFNYEDVSVVELKEGVEVDNRVLSIGVVNGSHDVSLKEKVHKYGRTSEYTRGTCIGRNAVISVNYGGSTGFKRFKGLDMFSKMSDSGDSGSVIVSEVNGDVVSLLFAGSGNVTIGIPFKRVMSSVGFDFV